MAASIRVLGAALLLLCALLGWADAKSEELTPKDFKKTVVDGKDVWIVLFYAPWCGHCKAIFPEWRKMAEALHPSVKVAQVDADAHKDLGGQYGVQGFPTIKLFTSDKKKPQDYNGARQADKMAEHALRALSDHVMGKLGRRSGSSSGGSKSGGKAGGSQVINLNEADFKSQVLGTKDDWLIAFTAPWCGHCVKLKPEWEDAAKQLKGDFKLGWVDATQEGALAQQYQVQGYPTIKMFAMKDGKKVPSDYNGGRDASGIVNYVQSHIEATGSAKPISEITSKDVFADECSEDWHGICVLAFLPNILDDQVSFCGSFAKCGGRAGGRKEGHARNN